MHEYHNACMASYIKVKDIQDKIDQIKIKTLPLKSWYLIVESR